VQFSNSLAGGRYCIIIANHLHLVLFLAYEHPRHKCKCQLMKVYALLALFALNFTVKMPRLLDVHAHVYCRFSCDVTMFKTLKLPFLLRFYNVVSSDYRPYRNLAFYNVLARQGSSFCNRACLNFQAFALRD